jgi:multiple sugar transport system permease protein
MSASTTSSLPTQPGTPGPDRPAHAPTAEPTNLKVRRVLRYVVLIALAIVFISPLLFMIVTSFKTRADAGGLPPSWWPSPFSTDAYATVLGAGTNTPVLRWFGNSMIAATLHSSLVVTTSALAAYALARMDFRGKKIVFGAIIATLFVPPVILIIPNYLIVAQLYWLDTLTAIIIPTAASAFGVFFLRQFFIGLPVELEEAARLDGANRWQVFWKVVLPLSRPALVTLGMLAFLSNYNDFLWPVYVLFAPENQTLPAGLSTLQTANAVRYDLLMAGAVVASVPVLVLYMGAQRFIIEGVSRSGLKG